MASHIKHISLLSIHLYMFMGGENHVSGEMKDMNLSSEMKDVNMLFTQSVSVPACLS